MAPPTSPIRSLLATIEDGLHGDRISEFMLRTLPCPGSFRMVSAGGIVRTHEESIPAEIRYLQNGITRFQCATDAPRGREVQMSILAEQDVTGELHLLCRLLVRKTTRISGAYEFEAEIRSIRKRQLDAAWVFARHAAQGDAGGWNRWIAKTDDPAHLQNLHLVQARLAQFDLCCADLRGSNLEDANLSLANLAGADLRGCHLDGVRVDGADLFGVTLPRRYKDLLAASGLVETESVHLVEDDDLG